MKKIGSLTHLFAFFLLLPFGQADLFARQIQIDARSSASDIFYGESFQLTIDISSSESVNVLPPVLPTLEAFRFASTTPSRGTRVSIVNGKTEQSTTFTYTLTAVKSGTHTIPPIPLKVSGQSFQTAPIQIRVVDRGATGSNGQVQLPAVFVTLEPAVENPVTGQKVLTEVVLYFKEEIEVTTFRPGSGWQPDSFWKEDLASTEQPRAESTIYKGQRFRKATLLRYALFPTLSGTLELPAYPLSVTIRNRSSRNDPFDRFFSRTNTQNLELLSEPVEIKVRPVPPLPDGVTGLNAVGQFEALREITKTMAVVGESVELITTIKGSGNIPLIKRPEYAVPEQFDLFNPREISDIEMKGTRVSGSRQFTEFLIPRAPGVYTLPEEQLAYYDPEQNGLQFITIPPIRLDIRSAPNLLMGSQNGNTFALQPVRGLALWVQGDGRPAFRSPWFWVLVLIPPIGMLLIYRMRSFRERLQTDKHFRRKHHAEKMAEQYLSKARFAAEGGDGREAYRFVEKALAGYISDRLNLQEAGYSAEYLMERLPESADPNARKKLKILLDRSMSIGYAPPGTAEETLSDVELAEELLQTIKGWISK